jgi:UDP-sulfoquinovose synthase
MRILVLGGDGFCGWPTVLHLSRRGHEVVVVDDLSRRRIDEELSNASLTPIRSIHDRVGAWRELTGQRILFEQVDVAADYEAFCALLRAHKPGAIVHLAEQRSVPYSMRSAAHRRFTVDNNVSATHNVLAALADCALDAHLVHLGSVGVYGYETLSYRIPEGYIEVSASQPQAREAFEMLHPVNPPSVYHMTKALDQVLLAYYAKNDGIRITDLLQGIVWGTQTAETSLDERLINRFDYDAVYGTVLNRFVLQATLGHPISVYGSGGQTRAFIHIADAVRCIELAIANPPAAGSRLRVFNQATESLRVADLAKLIAQRRPGTEVVFLDNPRQEPSSNEFDLANDSLVSMGFEPTKLADHLLVEMTEVVERYAFRCNPAKILPRNTVAEPDRRAASAGGAPL